MFSSLQEEKTLCPISLQRSRSDLLMETHRFSLEAKLNNLLSFILSFHGFGLQQDLWLP